MEQIKKKKISRIRKNEIFWGYAFISPLAIGLLVFLAAPLIFSLYISLTKYDLFNQPVFVGFENFARAFSSSETQFWLSIKNALIMSLGVPISMAVSLVAAVFLSSKLKGTNFFKLVIFLPTICSAVALSIMWKRVFDYNYGLINNILALFNIEKINWLDYDHAVGSLMFMNILNGLGINLLLYLAAVKAVPATYYEAAKLDGANGVQQFFKITMPSISPVSFYILVTGLIGSLQGFTQYQIMTNGSPSNTLMPVLIIYNYMGNDYGSFYGYASALAIILGAIIALITIFNFTVSKKFVYYES